MRKISLPLVVTVMCLLVSLVLGLFWINQKRQSPTKTSETKITRTNYSAVARKTLDWIDKQRNDEGWYILERGCDFEAKTCDTVWDNTEGNKDGLIATWARFNYYQQTKDPADLEIVKSDINKFYEKYPDGVDNALWICKITFDMWKSDLFDEEMKGKLEKICFSSGSSFSEIVGDNGYDMFIYKPVVVRQVGSVWKTWQGYSFVVRGVNGYFGLASDLLSQYLWTKDKSKLNLAKEYFESGKKIIERQAESVGSEDDCLLGLSAVDLYEYGGKDESYLNYAKERYLIFSDENSDVKKYRTAICGLLTKKLYQISEDKTFLGGLEKNNKTLVNGLLDGEESVVNKTGSYGFFVTKEGGFSMAYKNVAENGLVVELLRD
jgi:hypothetical protein